MHCFVGSLLFVIPHVQLLLFGSVAHPFALFLNLWLPNQENELLRFVFQFTPTKGWFSIFILWYCWCLSFPTFSHLGVDVDTESVASKIFGRIRNFVYGIFTQIFPGQKNKNRVPIHSMGHSSVIGYIVNTKFLLYM